MIKKIINTYLNKENDVPKSFIYSYCSHLQVNLVDFLLDKQYHEKSFKTNNFTKKTFFHLKILLHQTLMLLLNVQFHDNVHVQYMVQVK